MITRSTILWVRDQADGRRWVRERHERDDGPPYDVEYLAAPGSDERAAMLARVPVIEAQLAEEAVAREEFVQKKLIMAAKDTYFNVMTEVEIKAVLKLPADVEVKKVD